MINYKEKNRKGFRIMIEVIKNYTENFFWNLPAKYQKQFEKEKDFANLRRMKFLLIFFSFISFMVFLLQFFKEGINFNFYFQTGVLLITIFFTYIYIKKTPDNVADLSSFYNYLFYITIIFLLAWTVIRAGYMYYDSTSLFLYIFSMFFISIIFYFKWRIYLLVFGVISGILLVLNYLFAGVMVDIFARFLLITNVYIFGFVFSRVSYLNLMENVIKLKEKEAEYKSVIDKNNRLEEILEEKKTINNELRKEVKELKEKFSYSLQKTKSGFWEWEIDKDRIIYNREWAKILDYHVNKLDGRLETWKDLVHPEDREKFNNLIENVKNGEEKSFELEHRLKTGEGKWKWMMAQGKITEVDEVGNPLKAEGIHKDISLLKTLEKKLRHNNKKLKKILNSLPFAVMLYKDNRWHFINKATEDLLAYSREELIDTNNWSFIDSDYLKWIGSENKDKKNKFANLKIVSQNNEEKLVDFYASKIIVENEEMIILIVLEK